MQLDPVEVEAEARDARDPHSTLEWISPHEIEAMEVYTRASRVPAQYQMDSQCGVILVWTRR